MIAADPLRLVEMLAVLEESSAPLLHDVRNRIASMRNLAFFVRRKLSTETVLERDPRVSEFLNKIDIEVQRTDDMIELWSARNQALRPKALRLLPLADSVRLALDSARLPACIELVLSLPSESIVVSADLEPLAFAVRCLVENAGEAVAIGLVQVAIAHEASGCRITVSDSGPGIADPAHCLTRTESTKPGHLGLGLRMARRIVARFGGDLVIQQPMVGAEVSLRLPVAPSA